MIVLSNYQIMTYQKYLAFGDISFRKLIKTLISLIIDIIVTKYFLIWLKKYSTK